MSDGYKAESAWAFEALDKIGRLIMRTPQDALVKDMEQAALKIQSLYRGRAIRKDPGSAKTPSPKGKACGKARGEEDGPEATDVTELVSNNTNKMVALFSSMDVSGDGMLQVEEFVGGIEQLPGISEIKLSNGAKLDHETLLKMTSVIDVSG